MGDLASRDKNGYIKIYGRTKDLINRGGYKINPHELECLLVDHPSVEQIWDLANAIRRTSLDVPPLMGIATDDSHEYHGRTGSRPGRGWVMSGAGS